MISDNNTTTWSQVSTSGLVPLTTFAARVSVFGTALTGGPDGYIDNVVVPQIVPEASTVVLAGIGLAAAGLGLRRRRGDS